MRQENMISTTHLCSVMRNSDSYWLALVSGLDIIGEQPASFLTWND